MMRYKKGALLILVLWMCLYHFVNVQSIENKQKPFGNMRDQEVVTFVQGSAKESGNITIVGDEFLINGRPLHIISGSLHYYRLPAVYWRDRLKKLKAAGLNSVATYVEWSYHEVEERQYSFEGDRDVAQFVRLAAEEGLHVLLRPGPYICAERDLGGLPYWLLSKYPNIKLRTTNKDFIEETRIWMNKLFEQLSPLLFGNGGPIILVQVENEYGSYSNDTAYMVKVRDILLEHVGTNALLYTTDGPYRYMVTGGHVPGALSTIDFGVDVELNQIFGPLRQFMPSGPLMNSEFYPGWLTHWGENLQQVATEKVVRSLRAMVELKINVNIYVFFGGTNFEFSSGANYGSKYQPDITSYDYDAPLNEAGDPTPKYYAIRNLLMQFHPELNETTMPVPSKKGNYGEVIMNSELNLLSLEGRSKLGKRYIGSNGLTVPTFEALRQRAGLVLYETILQDIDGELQITKPRDWIYVYVDGVYAGSLNRMNSVFNLELHSKSGSVLSLLVENQGRINYGSHIHDFKGILNVVTYKDKALQGPWSITGYPLENIPANASAANEPSLNHGPVLYKGQFTLPEGEVPLDTFLDPTGWGRGYAWINGHNLGRYWPSLGPQVTLYVPGAWLHAAPAANTLQLLELEASATNVHSVQLIDHPILDRTSI